MAGGYYLAGMSYAPPGYMPAGAPSSGFDWGKWGPYIGGAAALAGSIWSARSMRQEAEKNRAFQERMSSTSHQREVADLKAAGLNPALSATGGSGSSTPAGSTATVPNLGDLVPRAVASALAVKQYESQTALLDAQSLEHRTRAYDMQTTAPMRYTLMDLENALRENDLARAKAVLPYAIAKAQAEVDQVRASARSATASAILDELSRTGAVNERDIEELLRGHPAARLVGRALQKLGPGVIGGVVGAAAQSKFAKPPRTIIYKR